MRTAASHASSSLVPSALEWDLLADTTRAAIAHLETRFPHVRMTALFQETSGLLVDKSPQEESITLQAPFPVPFTGASFVLKVTNGLEATEWASNTLTAEELARGFAFLEDAAANLPPPKVSVAEAAESPLEAHFCVAAERRLADVSLEEKMELVRADFQRLTALAPHAHFVRCRYSETAIIELFVSREKKLRQELSNLSRSLFAIVPKAGGGSAQAYQLYAAQGGFEKAILPESVWGQFAESLPFLSQTKQMTPGEYELVVDGHWAGLIAHEAFGHGAEGDMFEKNRAQGVSFLGKKVGSPLVNMMDSPSESGARASFFFDHEGVLATPTQIIKDGILVRPIAHLATAQRQNILPSANGRRQSPLNKLYTRMTNTFFLPGSHTLDQMIASIPYGFYLQCPTGGMEDPKGWGIQCQGDLAREIKDGKFTGRTFGPVCMTGHVPELLSSISMVEEKMHPLSPGVCGKGHKEWVTVTDGGPALRLRARLS